MSLSDNAPTLKLVSRYLLCNQHARLLLPREIRAEWRKGRQEVEMATLRPRVAVRVPLVRWPEIRRWHPGWHGRTEPEDRGEPLPVECGGMALDRIVERHGRRGMGGHWRRKWGRGGSDVLCIWWSCWTPNAASGLQRGRVAGGTTGRNDTGTTGKVRWTAAL